MQCAYIKQDGSQCWAYAMSGSEYCWFHAPEVDYDRKTASQKGGQVKRAGLYADLNPIPLKKIDDVPEFLMDTIRQVRGGFIGGKIAVTLGYLCGKLMKSFESSEKNSAAKKIEEELKELQKEKAKPGTRKKTRVKKPKKRSIKTDVSAKSSDVRSNSSDVSSKWSEIKIVKK